MELIRKLRAEARISEAKQGKQAVNFTPAQNDFCKHKGGSQAIKIMAYVKSNYRRSPKAVPLRITGVPVQTTGRPGIETYLNRQRESAAANTGQVNRLAIQARAASPITAEQIQAHQAAQTIPIKEPLPF